jgi:hypothetical protein
MKPVYTFLYLLLGCSLLALSSCKDCSTSVAQFENGENTWTVYNSGAQLFMRDGTDTVRFVNTRAISEPIPGEGFSLSDACIEQYYTRRVSTMQDPSGRLPGLSVVAIKQPDTIRVSLVVINRAEFLIPDINTPQLATQTINGNTYTNVFDLQDETATAPTGVRRILFNREFGFLQVEYASGRVLSRLAL